MPTAFRRDRSIMNGLDGLFSRQNRTMRANLGQISDKIKTIKCKKFDHNYASLTFASRRKNRPDHGSCLRNTRARLVFPLTTLVRITEDKKYSHNPALQAAEEVIVALNG